MMLREVVLAVVRLRNSPRVCDQIRAMARRTTSLHDGPVAGRGGRGDWRMTACVYVAFAVIHSGCDRDRELQTVTTSDRPLAEAKDDNPAPRTCSFSYNATGPNKILFNGDTIDINPATQDADLAQLRNCTNVRRFYSLIRGSSFRFYRHHITDEGIEHLRSVPNLEDIYLQGCFDVTDRSLDVFASLKHLKHLDLSQTGVSEAAVHELRLRMPHCEILTGRMGPDFSGENRGPHFPPVSALRAQSDLPDVRVGRLGLGDWYSMRRPELIDEFQHYMYGKPPAPPTNLQGTIDHEDRTLFGGKATLRLVTLKFGPPAVPPWNVLVVIPNQRKAPGPVFLGLNRCGNHTLLSDRRIPLPGVWTPAECEGTKDNRATWRSRGTARNAWAIEQSIDRGYAIASCFSGEIDPDRIERVSGVRAHFVRWPCHADWGTIAAWAWGLQRVVDYLVTVPEIDATRIAVVGHGRLGNAALLAGASDERIALVVAHQTGCGGAAPNRSNRGETVRQINDRFPHWFCDRFKLFNENVDRLPFDQHCLIALCAPRPVLVTNATEDSGGDPEGTFRMLEAASPVYAMLGVEGLETSERPPPGRMLKSRLSYFLREGDHSMTRADWEVFLQFADAWMPPQ